MEIKVLAPAKINLTLDVTGKRPDGYHNILSIMQSVDLYDTITVTDNDSGQITVSCNYEGVPCDEKNICYKAAERFFIATRNEGQGVHIDIDKVIPTQAGLAGGSTDGAAVLMGLNKMFDAFLKPDELHEIAEKIGADVPFCLVGGTKYATGIGTKLQKMPNFLASHIVICKPDNVSVSTAEAYKKVDALNPHPPYTDEMIKSLFSRDMFRITSTLFNDFELALKLEEVNDIKRIMYKRKALGASMSGSGSAVFAAYNSERKAKKCVDALKEKYDKVFLCHPTKEGCKIV